jgi:hypothetical protein
VRETRRGGKRTLLPSRKYSRGLLRKKELFASKSICQPLTCCSDSAALVTFLIGPGDAPEKFIVHKEAACYHSKVFDAAFNNTAFIEDQTQTYKMDDTTNCAFRFLVQWFYFKKLEITQLKETWPSIKNDPAAIAENQSLAELWILGDKLGIPELQNLTIEIMWKIVGVTSLTPTQSFKYIYKNTCPASVLRRYVVDSCAFHLNSKYFSESSHDFPHEMFADIITLYSERYWADGKSKESINLSDYRVSDDTDEAS